MKNLKLLNIGQVVPQSRTYPDLEVLDSVFDVISDSLTFVLGTQESQVLEVQQFMKTGQVNLLASLSVNEFDKMIMFAHFEDTHQLVIIFEQGDIMNAVYDETNPDPDTTMVEIVGSIDCGIKAAKWSPDEETLAVLTQENNLVLLTRTFEPIAEKYLNPQDINTSTHVSVGWGKKETQFKGKGAKQLERDRLALKNAGLNIDSDHAILHDPTVAEVQQGQVSEFDSFKSDISWRGDSQYVSLSNVEEIEPGQDRRVIRVYSREGELDSCSEAVDGHEEGLAWKPQGSLIASTRRRFEEEINEQVVDLIFFERNGLRHGEFPTQLPENSKILQLDWSCNSEMLAFRLYNRIQIWTTKNYHWYLKQEIYTSSGEETEFLKFHPENPTRIMFGTNKHIEIVDMAYSLGLGPTSSPYDVGMALVADGPECKITPLGLANVPPPSSLREVLTEDNLVDVGVSRSNSLFALLSYSGVSFATVDLDKIIRGNEPVIRSRLLKTNFGQPLDRPRQICCVEDNLVAVLFDSNQFSRLALISVVDVEQPTVVNILDIFPPKPVLLKPTADFSELTYETSDGSVYLLDSINFEATKIGQFPQLCSDYWVSSIDEKRYCFGLSSTGKLYVNQMLACSGVTSFLVTDSYLLYTTAKHQLKFVHMDHEIDQNPFDENEEDERTRMIERGSLLVTAIPSKAVVVLQAPRGNLETIHPRIMILTEVRHLIKHKQYKEAFIVCRTHRIALDILHDYDSESFFKNVELFIKDIKKPEHIELFLSTLLEEDVVETKYRETETTIAQDFSQLEISEYKKPTGKEKISKICEAVLSVLLTPAYKSKYLQTIITAYACQHPPKTTQALELIGSFKDEAETEKAVQHLCFLLDVNMLYEEALGIYNVPLTLVIAQQSQKDPKEYLPFLQKLHVQPDLTKKFMIDEYLKKYEKALDSLVQYASDDEILEFVIEHSLYKHALALYRYTKDKFDLVMKSYADHLHESREYGDAALAYETLSMKKEALENHVLARNWEQAVVLAIHDNQLLEDTCTRLVALLTDTHEYTAAAYIQLKFLNNIEESLKLYCSNHQYAHAIMLCYQEKKEQLVESVVDPALGEGFGIIADLLADCKGQVNSQLGRLRELRSKKQEDPFAYYGEMAENDTPDNVSIAASETSTKESFFTRYTGKTQGTAKTGASRRTAKNRRREERKKARGKKGTIYEEEYLVKSVGRLVERLDQTQPEALRLIDGLVRRNMMHQAYEIQKNFVELRQLLQEHIKEIYDISEKDRERIDDNGLVYLVPELPVPEIVAFPKRSLLDY
ncbi:hypothetical protein OGAPHI_001574 [Ogataea philodendri]|uniref:Elongator complex protein 1 n=1 Tax=Ogataea philodendri TaxID=1378263 RepID=A0A9P8T7Q7_9ASCO|nr:uncharacterized protein OGAPHI_001574 [Ogataea philodendri]KAH3669453.1 hypothetical protein OGAPHI_001574 [Ogataea philodendri]